MAIDPDIKFLNQGLRSHFVAHASVIVGWEQVGGSTYLIEDADANPITSVDAEITDPTRQIFSMANRIGSLLALRMRRTKFLTTVNHPVVKVFVRTRTVENVVDDWQILRNLHGEVAATIMTDSSDLYVDGGENQITTPHATKTQFDIQGCNEFLVGVEVIMEAETGDLEIAALQVKII